MALAECDNDHDSIAYQRDRSTDKCPMCELMKAHKDEKDTLEHDVAAAQAERDEANEYIAKLEEENAQLREQLASIDALKKPTPFKRNFPADLKKKGE